MALSLCMNPVAFLGGAAGCVFVSLSMHRFPFRAQSSESSTFDCLFDSNGSLSVCLFESNGRLSSCCSSAFAVCSLGSKDDVLWPQSSCSVSSFLTHQKKKIHLIPTYSFLTLQKRGVLQE